MPRLSFWRPAKKVLNPLVIDQLASSGSNVLLVLIASRAMNTRDFAVFATLQLVAVTLMGVARLAVYGPALSAQRERGRLRIPSRWVLPISAILALAGSPAIAWTMVRGTSSDPLEIALVCTLPAAAFAQDGLRYVRMSESRFSAVLASDIAWLCITLPLVSQAGRGPVAGVAYWGLGAGVGVIFLLRSSETLVPEVTIGATWLLGRWGLIDSSLGAFVIAGPTITATAFLDQSLVGTYRVMQSAVSPMNLVNSVLVVSFGLGAWQLNQASAVDALRRRVRQATVALVALALTLATIGVYLASSFATIDISNAWKPWIVVAGVTLVGAWMSARQAASMSLGMQHYGAATRLVSATYAGIVMVVATHTSLVGDPIGLTLVGTTIVSLIGSQSAYQRGISALGTTSRVNARRARTMPRRPSHR